MNEFVIEVMINGENRIVQMEPPTGGDYMKIISETWSGDDLDHDALKHIITLCSDITHDDIENMRPKAINKTLLACQYAIKEKVPEDGEIESKIGKFGTLKCQL